MSKKIKNFLIFAAIAIAIIIIDLLIIRFFSLSFNNEYDVVTDVQQYNEVIIGSKWGMSEEIFPQNIDNLNVLEFKHVYYDPWDANYLAYLVVDYNHDDYEKEVKRLNECGIEKYIGYYSVTGFSNYQLLAMQADSYNGFVYAISDGESKIIYVELIFCNYYMDINYEEQIPEEYLPDGFNAKLDNPYQKGK